MGTLGWIGRNMARFAVMKLTELKYVSKWGIIPDSNRIAVISCKLQAASRRSGELDTMPAGPFGLLN